MVKPEIGLSMLYCLDKPFKYVLSSLPELNVKHVELTDEGFHALTKNRIKKLKEIAKTNNLDFVVHAPWANVNIATISPVLRRAVLKRLRQSLVLSGQLDCLLWLFHPGFKSGLDRFYPGKDWELNLDSVRSLLKVAQQEGVTIAIENIPEPFPALMKSVDDFHRFYQDLNDDIGMVLDVAHANLNNQINDFIQQFSKKIIHMHLSDNQGTSDQHLGIGYGTLDWQNFAKAVKKARYDKLLMIESTDHPQQSIQYLNKLFT
ncbi:MAG: sugar phosphate isomerase/epimerase [Candidatus Bathyarchaeota archaeon]|nr:sugar phosphate isomerase/epimerase [Candidatus Bathyarchaeum tardum]WGM89782.1 MAG: sugar phosphate isomerase/epimerase [Candidatus Bathyarchaeum tardum]